MFLTIRFSFVLSTYDDDGVSYDGDIRDRNYRYTGLRLDVFTQYLQPGETFLDRRCRGGYEMAAKTMGVLRGV